jgi:hypothetical protein
MMKNSEEAIEKVLAGLRDAEAPVGMERRILSALEERESVRTRSGWRWLRPVWLVMPLRPVVTRSVVCGVALAGLFAIVVAIPASRKLGQVRGHAPARARIDSPSVGSRPLAPSETAAVSAPHSPTRSGVLSVRKTSVKGEEEGVVRRGDRDVSADNSDSVAASEMQAASFPAPPMPLTEQERLLLRIVHKNDPVEIAMLDPNQRNLEERKERAEYQSFFSRPVIEQPTMGQTAPEQAVPASDPAQGKQLEEQQQEGQQQIPNGDDNKKSNDKSKNNADDNGKNKGETE